MREIEFRVWDEELKHYLAGGIFPYMVSGFMRIDKNVVSLKSQNNTVIEQYTGLKDKSGKKKIFGGDILENKKYRSIVEFRGCAFSAKVIFNGKQTGQYFDLRGEASVSNVVGNIHENQKLLDTRKEVK